MDNIDNDYVSCTIKQINNKLLIKGFIKNAYNYKKKILIAPNPVDKITSFSGKCLPFPCETIAFENTPNFKVIDDNGAFNVEFSYPNSYYSPDGYKKIKSPIIFSLDDKKIIIELKDYNPLKTLRDRSRGDPNFYSTREFLLPLGTAEQNMNNYSYAKIVHNIA